MTRNNSSCKLRTLVFNCSVRQAPLYAVAFLAMLLFQPVYTLLNIRSRTQFSDMSNPDVYSSVCKDLRGSLLVNVPAAVLLSGFTDNWRELLLGVDIGGLGTPVASLASLITLKLYLRSPGARPARYLAVFTAWNAALLAVLLAAVWLTSVGA